VEIHVMDHGECRSAYQASQLDVADTEICAMKPSSVANACYGDSGGPLMVLAKQPKRYVQVGVVSWGDRCGRVGVPNVYARVSAFHDWIEETMASDTSVAAEPSEASEPAAASTRSPE
jgi:secreted trypsin-like serine protease